MKRVIIYILSVLVYKLIIFALFKFVGDRMCSDFFDTHHLCMRIDDLNSSRFYNAIILIYSVSYIFTVILLSKIPKIGRWVYIILSIFFYTLLALPFLGIGYLMASFCQYFLNHVLLHLIIIALLIEGYNYVKLRFR